MKKVLILFIFSFLMLINVKALPSVSYDNFNITDSNHAKIVISLKNIDDSNIVVTGKDASKIKLGKYNNWVNEGVSETGIGLYYNGPIAFGSGTSTAKTVVDAVIKLRFNNGALLYDGTKADVLMTISDIEFNVRELGNTSLNKNSDYYMLIALSKDSSSFWFYSQHPQSKVLTDKKYENLTNNQKDELTSLSNSGNSYKVNIKLLKSGTDTPIDSKYSNLAFGMSDIDTTDKTVSTINTENENDKIITQGSGEYNEGVELIEGFNNVIHFATNKPLEGNNITEQSILKTITGSHGGLKIVVDANKKADNKIRPGHNDDNTYYSGFITMASPQNLTFYWTGVGCGSQLFAAQDVIIREKHSEGGEVSSKSYGNDVSFDKTNTWENSLHPINSTPTYTFKAKSGYYLQTLKVDGKEVEISSDYRYTFDNLAYNPLVRLNEDATIKYIESNEPDYLVEPHSIEVIYGKDSFTITYENGGGKGEDMPNEQGFSGEKITLSKNKYTKKNYKFINWEVYIEDANGNRTKYLDSNGNQIYFKDREKVDSVPVENGGALVLVATWKQRGIIINSKTILIGVIALLIISLVGFIVYKMKEKDKFSNI